MFLSVDGVFLVLGSWLSQICMRDASVSSAQPEMVANAAQQFAVVAYTFVMVIFHLTSSELHTKPNSIAAHFCSYFPLSLHRSKCKIATSWCGNAWLRLLHTISNTFNFFSPTKLLSFTLTRCVWKQHAHCTIVYESCGDGNESIFTSDISTTRRRNESMDDVEHTVVIHKINFCLSLYGFSASCKCKLLLFDTKCIHNPHTQNKIY